MQRLFMVVKIQVIPGKEPLHAGKGGRPERTIRVTASPLYLRFGYLRPGIGT